MSAMIELIQGGSVTSAKGFVAGGTYAGIKTSGEDSLDLGILKSDNPAAVAGTFSTNKVLSPSVTLSKQRIANGSARAVVVKQRLRQLLCGRARAEGRRGDGVAGRRSHRRA